jgi:nitronate monooxygenase
MLRDASHDPLTRAIEFAEWVRAKVPVFMAPMAGASPVSLASAVANAGGIGAYGALLMSPQTIAMWVSEFRQETSGPFQINLWVPDPPPLRNAAVEERQRAFLSSWGPEIPAESVDAPLQNFEAQCRALIEAKPTVISSIMGAFPPAFVEEMKAHGIRWFATATTVAEAREAEAAGADAIVAQGSEAGGHRGAFRAADAETEAIGLFALIPQVCDAVSLPVIATGGISDDRTIAAALVLGASAVQIGTGLFRAPEAKIHPAYAATLGKIDAHDTRLTKAFSGRTGRAIRTRYVEAAAAPDAPPSAPYPVQRALTRGMRDEADAMNDPDRMQMWAGQSARLAKPLPAASLVHRYWDDALSHLR